MKYYRLLLLILIVLGLGFGGIIRAQDTETPTDPALAPTEIPTDIPTEIPTDASTAQPTDVPTDAPTDVATEVPTDVATDAPTDVATDMPPDVTAETPTEIATVEATPEVTNAAPIFSVPADYVLAATANVLVSLPLSVADDSGPATISVDTTGTTGVVSVTPGEVTEANGLFYTAATIEYTAPADFSGTDSLTLTATDAAGLVTSLILAVEVTPVEATLEPTTEPTAIPSEVRIITYNPNASEDSIQAMLTTLGAIEVSRIPQIGAMKVQIPQAVSDTASVTAALSADVTALSAGVTSVEPDMIYTLDAFPNDPYYTSGTVTVNQQWGLYGPLGTTYVGGATGGWSISTKDGTGVIVAVIDSGIDKTHPDLVGKLLPGYDFYNNDADTDDDNSHGTHVAGVIAANTNNGIGIAGIAYNAKLLPVKVCTFDASCPTYEVAAGIVFAVDKGAKVANLSLGGSAISTTVQAAVQYALSRNVTIVAAAGNTSGTAYQYPASFPGVISVAAHDINGLHASFSTANDRVTVSAPGVHIVSTVPPEFDTCDGIPDGYSNYSYNPGIGLCLNWDGTSMAAPHVTGIVALMLSDNVVNNPAAAKAALICSALDAGAAGKDNQYGYGWVQGDWAQNWRNNTSNCKVTAPNDLYQNATKITTVPYTNIQAIDSRSTSKSDSDPATLCAVANQSVWYQFKPTVSDNYQISTMGSSYDTAISVWQMPEEGAYTDQNFIGCNNDYKGGDFYNAALMNAALTAGQIYYIEVVSVGVANDAVLTLDVRHSLSANNVDNQETSSSIFYYGSWVQSALSGASGGQVKTTGDNNALAVFTFRGDHFDLGHSIGPTYGSLEVWIDGSLQAIVSNRAALAKQNQIVQLGVGGIGNWHQVVLRRSATGPAGPVDIDRIKTYEFDSVPTAAITALTDDSLGGAAPCAAKKFCYFTGTFSVVAMPGANLGKVTRTTTFNAEVAFRATGTAITIFRSTGPAPTYGSMAVYVDGNYYAVSNLSSEPHVKVPFTISDLGAYSHVVRIFNSGGGTFDFDAAQASSPAALAASAAQTNENSASLVYSGYWENLVTPSALGNTTRRASDTNATVSFRFTGNFFCINYAERFGVTGSADVYEDGYLVHTINASGGSTSFGNKWCQSSLQSDRTHTVQLYIGSGTFELDGVWARRQAIITPSMGIIQENNALMTYAGTWVPASAHLLGGAAFQGGAAKSTQNDGDSVTFYMNGTGFVLYTSLNPTVNSGWEVLVDGSLYVNTLDGTGYTIIDTGYPDFARRFRPFAYAFTGLNPGIHKVELHKWLCVPYTIPGYSPRGACPTTDWVDFDGVRVFP